MSCTRKNGIRYPLDLDKIEKCSNGTDTPRFPSRESLNIKDSQQVEIIPIKNHTPKQLVDSLSFSF